jgi:hypothetical protein
VNTITTRKRSTIARRKSHRPFTGLSITRRVPIWDIMTGNQEWIYVRDWKVVKWNR